MGELPAASRRSRRPPTRPHRHRRRPRPLLPTLRCNTSSGPSRSRDVRHRLSGSSRHFRAQAPTTAPAPRPPQPPRYPQPALPQSASPSRANESHRRRHQSTRNLHRTPTRAARACTVSRSRAQTPAPHGLSPTARRPHYTRWNPASIPPRKACLNPPCRQRRPQIYHTSACRSITPSRTAPCQRARLPPKPPSCLIKTPCTTDSALKQYRFPERATTVPAEEVAAGCLPAHPPLA